MTLSTQRLEKAAEALERLIRCAPEPLHVSKGHILQAALTTISAYLGDTHVDVPREPTEKMIYVMHHQIDWCRDDQDTHVPEHPSQTDNGIGTTCKQDICDAYEAAISAELTERDAG